MQQQLALMEREMRIRNYSHKTIKSYLYGVSEYFKFKQKDFELLDSENTGD
jgi:hypothetical protein